MSSWIRLSLGGSRHRHWSAAVIGVLALFGTLRAESLVFPADAGLIDVTLPPYNARGDGTMDCTAAIQQALQDYPDQNRIIYLPDGTYRISRPLRWPFATSTTQGAQRATILQGQSREGTKLVLADYSPGYSAIGRPRPVLWLGDEHSTHERNAVRNLSIYTGLGNIGAVGIQLNTSEQGCIRHVKIVAGGGGSGVSGIDAAFVPRIGPCLIKDVRIEGFETGIRCAFTVNSLTLEDCEFVGQKSSGIRNHGQIISIRKMRSTNEVMAIDNRDAVGVVTVLDSVFQGLPGKHPVPAIYNRGVLYARNVMTPGYTNAIENRVGDFPGATGPEIKEYGSHLQPPLNQPFNLFPSPPVSLGLEIKETPEVPWDSLENWASPLKYGGLPNDARDDSPALQKAIDSGATTVYLPHGSWHLLTPVIVRGKVRRIIGCEAELNVVGGQGVAGFRIDNGDSKVVVIERLAIRTPQAVLFEMASDRTVVVSSCMGVRAILSGKGEIFLEDVSSVRSWTLRSNPVWARQWNLVGDGEKIRNEGGQLWGLGLRAEKTGTFINTLAKGRTELLGGLCVSSGGYKQDPLFAITDAAASVVVGEASFTGNPYQSLVTETRGAQVRRLTPRGLGPEAQLPARIGGVTVPLYTGYSGPGELPARGDADPKATPAAPAPKRDGDRPDAGKPAK